MSASVNVEDDYHHIPNDKLEWRESYYFNFVSHDKKTSGFTTIGVLPNQQKVEFILAFFCEDKQTIYFKEQKMLTDNQANSLLSDNALTYRLVEPMKKWEISFANENLDLRIQWKARFPPFSFGKGSETSWIGHFEQSGKVNGEAELPNGRKIPLCGYSQRDKSWGPRNWHIENWFALHAQFETYAIGLRRDMVSGVPHVSGGLASPRNQTVASQVEIETIYEKGNLKTPIGALTTIRFVDGTVRTLQSKLVSPKSFVKFSRGFANGSTDLFEEMAIHECATTGEKGTGLIEFLFTRPEP